jgi:hypothetical protein
MESLLVMIALNKRPVFIVGSPRSGTTLLHHMLVSSGGFALYRTESGVFAILGPRFGDLSVRRNREQLMEHWLRSDLFMLTGLDGEYIRARILNECHNPGDFLRIVMESMAEQQGVHRWLEDSPWDVLHMDEIKRTIPGALVIHIIRDGRDVALSLLKQGWIRPFPWEKDKGLVASAVFWEWLVRQGRADSARMAPDYLEIHYEDLVDNPQPTLDKIGSYIGHKLDHEQIKRVGIGSVSHPNTSFAGSKSFTGRWKKQLSAADLRSLEETIGGTLRELGYELSDPAVTRPLGAAARRNLYLAYMNFKQWAKMNTPLSRYLVNLDILRPGSIINGERSLSWPDTQTQ